MPDNIDLHIKNLREKLQLLLKKHALILKENTQLREQNELYKSNEKTLVEKNNELQLRINILKTSAAQLEGDEKINFEKSINSYIRTIDKCINFLNK